MKVNDYVKIKEDPKKIIYKVLNIENDICIIKGLHFRVIRKERISNLEMAVEIDVINEQENEDNLFKKVLASTKAKSNERKIKQRYMLGKILHLDGDKEYLDKCLELYESIGIYAYGECVNESDMVSKIGKYLLDINPDIVVITGHDLYNEKGKKEINNYLNTKHFISTIKEIRKYRNDSCIIIAGACQSNFDALIANGADFASSPKRINIHTFDPAIIAIKAATTSFTSLINENDIYKYIENDRDAFGGVQTFGKMKLII